MSWHHIVAERWRGTYKEMSQQHKKAFSLVEIMITIVLTAIIFLAIISGIIYILRGKQLAREHSMAQRQAAALVEQAYRSGLNNLAPYSGVPVLIDDNKTPDDPADDFMGTASLRMFNADDNSEIFTGVGYDMVIVQAMVEWTRGGKTYNVTMVAHRAP